MSCGSEFHKLLLNWHVFVRHCLRLAGKGCSTFNQTALSQKRTRLKSSVRWFFDSGEEDTLSVASPMHFNFARRIAAQNPLWSYRILGSLPFPPGYLSESRLSLPSTKVTGKRFPDGVISTVLFRTASYS